MKQLFNEYLIKFRKEHNTLILKIRPKFYITSFILKVICREERSSNKEISLILTTFFGIEGNVNEILKVAAEKKQHLKNLNVKQG